MNKISKFFKEKQGLAEFLRYLVIGFSTTFLNWGISIALKELTGLGTTKVGNSIITVIAWTLSTVFFAFWMYKFFVFRSRSMKGSILWSEFAGFTGARLLTLGVETVIVLLFCDILGFDEYLHFGISRITDGGAVSNLIGFKVREYYVVKLCACVITTILNYIFSKLIIFKKGQKLTLAATGEDQAPDTALDSSDSSH